MGVGRVSTWSALFAHIRVSTPCAEHVAAVVTFQSPQVWASGSKGIERVSTWSELLVHILVSSPCAEHVAAVVTFQSPQVWASGSMGIGSV